jgi:hypothetical protein
MIEFFTFIGFFVVIFGLVVFVVSTGYSVINMINTQHDLEIRVNALERHNFKTSQEWRDERSDA